MATSRCSHGAALFAALAALHSTQVQAQGPPDYSAAFMPEAMFQESYLVLVNSNSNHAGPMLQRFLGANSPTAPPEFGFGDRMKVGLKGRLFYLTATEGPDPNYDPANPDPFVPANKNHLRYFVNRSPLKPNGDPEFTWPLPPDVTSIDDLPEMVRFGLDGIQGTRDDLSGFAPGDTWTATVGRCPGVIADLEWARYMDVPLSFESFRIFNQGGNTNPLVTYDVNNNFEQGLITSAANGPVEAAKYQCSWDVADICDPDDDATDLEPSGASFGSFTFATPTMADPDLSVNMALGDSALRSAMGARLYYQDYCQRNLQDGLEQLLRIAAFAKNSDGSYRYRSASGGHGLLAGFSIESEIKIPAHDNGSDLPVYPNGFENRYFIEDYHPVTIRMFQNYLEDKFGDDLPNVDSNGDGKTFESVYGAEYLSTGWVANLGGFSIQHPHSSADFGDWWDIDPPRAYPAVGAPRPPLWHEWLNFRAQMVDQFIDKYVGWWIDAGVPPTRMFSHMSPARASTFKDRGINNKEHLDEWAAIEVSGGYAGINKYWLDDYGESSFLLEQLHRRDDGWGSPEFAPSRQLQPNHPTNPGGFPSGLELRDFLKDTLRTRGHAMHFHSWSKWAYRPYDRSQVWDDPQGPTRPLAGWVASNLAPSGGFARPVTAGMEAFYELVTPLVDNGNEFLTSDDGMPFMAEDHPFMVLRMQNVFDQSVSGPRTRDALRVDFKKVGDPNWHSATSTVDNMPEFPKANQRVIMDLASASSEWKGEIESLRIYPCPTDFDGVKIWEAHMASQSPMSFEQQRLAQINNNQGRPSLPPEQALMDGADPLAPHIPAWFDTNVNAANLVVYGCEPSGTAQDPQFDNYGYVGNFFPTSIDLGGTVLADSIKADPPTFLGDRKTGRFRQLRLPDQSSVLLTFRLGLEAASLGTGDDGVEYRVRLRRHDAGRELVEVFNRRFHGIGAWSQDLMVADLSPYAGELVDLLLETHSIADEDNDGAYWGDPVVYSLPPLADFEASSASIPLGGTVHFTDLSEHRPTNWLWEVLPSGQSTPIWTSTEQNPSYTFPTNSAGNFSVRLTTMNPVGGDSRFMQDALSVGSAPNQYFLIADFDMDQDAASPFGQVDFTDSSLGNPVQWDWDFDFANPGVSTSSLQEPSFTYSSTGDYDVRLVITDIGGQTSTHLWTHAVCFRDAQADFTPTTPSYGWEYVSASPSFGTDYQDMDWDGTAAYRHNATTNCLVMVNRVHPIPSRNSLRVWEAPSQGLIRCQGSVTLTGNPAVSDGVNAIITKRTAGPSFSESVLNYMRLPDTSGATSVADLPALEPLSVGEALVFRLDAGVTAAADSTEWLPLLLFTAQ